MWPGKLTTASAPYRGPFGAPQATMATTKTTAEIGRDDRVQQLTAV
jgi:hypothetical protein